MIKEIITDGFVLAMDLTMISQEELEKVLHLQTWKSQNMNLLMLILLKLDKYNE
jgi:hypothetical protein